MSNQTRLMSGNIFLSVCLSVLLVLFCVHGLMITWQLFFLFLIAPNRINEKERETRMMMTKILNHFLMNCEVGSCWQTTKTVINFRCHFYLTMVFDGVCDNEISVYVQCMIFPLSFSYRFFHRLVSRTEISSKRAVERKLCCLSSFSSSFTLRWFFVLDFFSLFPSLSVSVFAN